MKPELRNKTLTLAVATSLLALSAHAQLNGTPTLSIAGVRPQAVDLRTPAGVQVSLDLGNAYGAPAQGTIVVSDQLSSCSIAVDGVGPHVCNWQPTVAGQRLLTATYAPSIGAPIQLTSTAVAVQVVANEESMERVSIPEDRGVPTLFYSRGTSVAVGRALSRDGRFAVFISDAPRLQAGAAPAAIGYQVFLVDQLSGKSEWISRGLGGAVPDAGCDSAAISADGQHVVFVSSASNLVTDDTGGRRNVFVYNRQTATIRLVSTPSGDSTGVDPGASDGQSFSPSISQDGQRIVFNSVASNLLPGVSGTQVYLRDLSNGSLTLVSRTRRNEPAGGLEPQISADGNAVVYYSNSTSLVSGDTNNTGDLFVYTVATQSTERVSRTASGAQTTQDSYEGSISANGDVVAFSTYEALDPTDTNGRADIYRVSRREVGATRISLTSTGQQANGEAVSPQISDDGHVVAFGDTADLSGAGAETGVYATYVYRDNGKLREISRTAFGGRALSNSQAVISGNGQVALFSTDDSRSVPGSGPRSYEVYARNLNTQAVRKLSAQIGGSEAADDSYGPSISADGRYVAFRSYADNLISGDRNGFNDVFDDLIVRDRSLSNSLGLTQARAPFGARYSNPELSRDARYTLYSTRSFDGGGDNLYRHDRVSGQHQRLTRTLFGTAQQGSIYGMSQLDNGSVVYFGSDDGNLTTGDSNGVSDIFLVTPVEGTIKLVTRGQAGVPANGASRLPSASATQQLVAYSSDASNLVAGDSNGVRDVFVTDGSLSTVRIGQPIAGGQANGAADRPAMSADGRYVVFESDASNLGAGDYNNATDIYVQDLWSGSLTLVSRNSAGLAAAGHSRQPSISDDGRRISFLSDATDLTQDGGLPIYVFDRITQSVQRVVHPAANSTRQFVEVSAARLSGAGDTLAFSTSSPLQAGDLNQSSDIYVATAPTF